MSLDDAAVASLVDAGFNAAEAAWALNVTGGSERAAANLLLDREEHDRPAGGTLPPLEFSLIVAAVDKVSTIIISR